MVTLPSNPSPSQIGAFIETHFDTFSRLEHQLSPHQVQALLNNLSDEATQDFMVICDALRAAIAANGGQIEPLIYNQSTGKWYSYLIQGQRREAADACFTNILYNREGDLRVALLNTHQDLWGRVATLVNDRRFDWSKYEMWIEDLLLDYCRRIDNLGYFTDEWKAQVPPQVFDRATRAFRDAYSPVTRYYVADLVEEERKKLEVLREEITREFTQIQSEWARIEALSRKEIGATSNSTTW